MIYTKPNGNYNMTNGEDKYPSVLLGALSNDQMFKEPWWYDNKHGLCFRAHFIKLI